MSGWSGKGRTSIIVMFNELTKQIQALLAEKPHVVVAITGFAGSGKSTLASKLADTFDVKDGQILRLDNFYAPTPRGNGLFDDYDWALVKTVLQDAQDSKSLHYVSRGFENDSSVFDEPLPKVVIIEGIQLFRKDFMHYFDIAVWIDCPLELALQRAKARDLSQGHDATYMKRWDTEWGPKNEEYFSAYHPDKLATFIYNEYK